MTGKIRNKVLVVILSTSLGTLLLLSITAMVCIFTMRSTVLIESDQLGETAAQNSEMALEAQVQQQIMSLAEDKASLADENLKAIENQTKMIADIATNIYTYPSRYSARVIDYLLPGQDGAIIPHVATAPDVPLSAVRREAYLAANIGDILRQITVLDIGLMGSYIGTEAGFTIIAEYDAPPNENNYDARTRGWYQNAKARDGLFWTDVFADASGKGAAISCAMPFYDLSGGGKVIKGVAGNGSLISENVNKIIDSAKIGSTGYAFILNEKGQVLFTPKQNSYTTDESGYIVGEDYLNSLNSGLKDLARRMMGSQSGLMTLELDGQEVYVAYYPLSALPWSLGVVVPIAEVIAPAKKIQQDILTLTEMEIQSINKNIVIAIIIILVVIVVAMAIAIAMAFRLSNSLTSPITALTNGAVTISGGDLNYRFDVKTNDEIEILAGSFNQMIGDIQTVTAEKQRINSELSVASEIQNDMLPRIFPKFSSHDWVALSAKMEPAKEVGGDFFDFFYLDEEETKIVFVIADVSGKGVPAALFMVIAKTLIKQQMLHSGDPADALEQTNKILCEDNPRSMFVTTLICSVDLKTGQMIYANGGHNPPLLSTGNEPYQFMQLKKGIPPGMMEESRYKICSLQLQPGDKLYLYTDGVNEAMNPKGEQFGNERFLEAANEFLSSTPEEFDAAIRQRVSSFVDGAEQSDDITTLAISYLGNSVENKEGEYGNK
jgi:sigma-B regulation protein RsbU (phosphoserine phosphatase)